MVANMDMSLEDIIKEKKIKPGMRRGGRGGANKTGNRGAGRSPGGRRGGGGAARGGAGGRGARRGNRGPFQGNRNNFGGARGGNVDGRWNHDMFQGGAGGGGAPRQSGPAKLSIDNLDFGVTDSDINELFSEFGPIRAAAVHYDRTGRSMGKAHVTFERMADAVKAVKQYNNVHLDARPMKITIEGQGGASIQQRTSQPVVKRLQQGARPIQGGRGGGARRGGAGAGGARGRGRGGRGGRQPRPKPPTAEELDAELDAYVNEVNK